jgi:hypothetical protein
LFCNTDKRETFDHIQMFPRWITAIALNATFNFRLFSMSDFIHIHVVYYIVDDLQRDCEVYQQKMNDPVLLMLHVCQ